MKSKPVYFHHNALFLLIFYADTLSSTFGIAYLKGSTKWRPLGAPAYRRFQDRVSI